MLHRSICEQFGKHVLLAQTVDESSYTIKAMPL